MLNTNFKKSKKTTYQSIFLTWNKYLFLFLLAMLSLFSCTKEETIMEELPISPYLGVWAGDFSGELGGTLSMTVGKTGFLSMIYQNTNGGGRGEIRGKVTEDGLIEVRGEDGGTAVEFTGSLSNKNGSGEWKLDSGEKGRWRMTKNE